MLNWIKEKLGKKKFGADALTDPRFWSEFFPITTASGEVVTATSAMQSAAVFACVRVLANGVSSLPFSLKRINNGVRSELSQHPIHYLIHHEPNPDMDASQFWRTIVGHQALRGQGDAFKVMTRSGRITELRIINPDDIKIKRRSDNGVVFSVRDGYDWREYSQESILHLPLFTEDGLTGVSPIRRCMETIGAALAAERFGASFYKNSMRPSAIMSVDGVLGGNSIERRNEMVAQIREQFTGALNAGKVPLLEHGLKYEKVSITPDEAQFLETRQFGIREICRVFGTPPHKIADLADAHHANIEEQNIDWVQDGLMPYIITIEKGCDRQLLTSQDKRSGMFTKFNVNALLRGNMAARAAYYKEMRQIGAMNADEVRDLEDMNPIGGTAGDAYWMPVNYTDSNNPVTAQPSNNGSPVANSNGNGRHN